MLQLLFIHQNYIRVWWDKIDIPSKIFRGFKAVDEKLKVLIIEFNISHDNNNTNTLQQPCSTVGNLECNSYM